MHIVSTLKQGKFEQKRFVRESDAKMAYWDFVAGMPDDGEGDDNMRSGIDRDKSRWGITLMSGDVEESAPEEEPWRDLVGMVCALTPSTYSVTCKVAPNGTRGTITVRDESDRADMWVQMNTVEDTFKVRVRVGWSDSAVIFEGAQCEALAMLATIRNHYALRG